MAEGITADFLDRSGDEQPGLRKLRPIECAFPDDLDAFRNGGNHQHGTVLECAHSNLVQTRREATSDVGQSCAVLECIIVDTLY